MAGVKKRVMDMVRREVEKDSSVKSSALYERAKKLDRTIRSLSLRQFHAQYPLQVKRARKSGRPAGAGRRPGRPSRTAAAPKGVRAARRAAASPSADGRAAVRAVLLDLAETVARAKDKAEMVRVIGGLDAWVDRVSDAVG